jgi:hypothetical protein
MGHPGLKKEMVVILAENFLELNLEPNFLDISREDLTIIIQNMENTAEELDIFLTIVEWVSTQETQKDSGEKEPDGSVKITPHTLLHGLISKEMPYSLMDLVDFSQIKREDFDHVRSKIKFMSDTNFDECINLFNTFAQRRNMAFPRKTAWRDHDISETVVELSYNINIKELNESKKIYYSKPFTIHYGSEFLRFHGPFNVERLKRAIRTRLKMAWSYKTQSFHVSMDYFGDEINKYNSDGSDFDVEVELVFTHPRHEVYPFSQLGNYKELFTLSLNDIESHCSADGFFTYFLRFRFKKLERHHFFSLT